MGRAIHITRDLSGKIFENDFYSFSFEKENMSNPVRPVCPKSRNAEDVRRYKNEVVAWNAAHPDSQIVAVPRIQYYTQPEGRHRTYVFATLYDSDTHLLSIGEAVFSPDAKDPQFHRRHHGSRLTATAIARLHQHPVVVEYVRPEVSPCGGYNLHKIRLMRNAVARSNTQRKGVVAEAVADIEHALAS